MSSRAGIFTLILIVHVAVPCLGQAAPGTQEEIAQHLRRAQQYLVEQQPALAIPELEKVVELDPRNIGAQGNLGVLLFFRGDYVSATPHLRAAVRAQPELWKIEALLGLAEARLNDQQASRHDLETAFPHLSNESIQLEAGRALIDNYTATGDLENAAATVSDLLATHPADKSLLALAYRLYSDLAGKAMLTLALTAPDSAEMHAVMARELAQYGDTDSAVVNYREAIRLNPQLPGLHSELGAMLYNSDDAKLKAEAPGELRAAVAMNPRDAKALLLLGKIAQQQGDLRTALEDETSAIDADPNDGDAYTEKANILVLMNRRAEAQMVLERAIEIDPSNYVAHYRLSGLYRQEGKLDAARRQVADYLRYKQLKEKLRQIFHDMKLAAEIQGSGDAGPTTP
jgi:Tfp pilus assembly protein PilF